MLMNPAPWNSLEITKLLAGLVTPAVLAFIGIYIHRITKRFEHLQWRSQKLIETRLKIYEELAPQLNDLLCYFTYVGCWKTLTLPRFSETRYRQKSVSCSATILPAVFLGVY